MVPGNNPQSPVTKGLCQKHAKVGRAEWTDRTDTISLCHPGTSLFKQIYLKYTSTYTVFAKYTYTNLYLNFSYFYDWFVFTFS